MITVELVRKLINKKVDLSPYPTDEDICKVTNYLQNNSNIENWYTQVKINGVAAFDAEGEPILEFSDKIAEEIGQWFHYRNVTPERLLGDGSVEWYHWG